MTQSSVISAVGLTKVFRDFWQRARVRAVSNVDLEVVPGEIYGLLGPNGSGKSTTIKMILGLLYPTRGRVSIFGKPADDVAIKSRIGYLPEESYLYRFLNARETLNYYGQLFQIRRSERTRRIEELLEMVGLRSAARRPVGEYSKGMQRRIGLAQALINDPDLLILDEPTSGLDPIGSKLVKDIIVRLGQAFKKTILLSSHLLADVEEVCSRVTILYGGTIQVGGTMEEVLKRQDMVQITCDRLSDETIRELQAVVQKREGKSLSVAVPRDRLESLFLRIVQEAHTKKVETAGSAQAGEIAGFLGQPDQARMLLESLTKPEPVRPAANAAAAAQKPAADAAVLGELTGQRPKPAEKTPAPAPPADVDRALLDDLAGPQERKP
ncbi:putative ABC transporter ATP-binding protein YxlF [Phycisphaerae bacterium RAS1]|nr:putative ABC transporter ATP-binding protein YxlF [Phycisphaerae bacterium RAS1]